jgi:DNA-directed RNA polymerase beta' subunit
MMNQNGLENGNNYVFIKFMRQAIKRIRILENLFRLSSSPTWMILTILHYSSTLRPMIQLERWSFRDFNLNELYRQLTRNNRLLRLLEIDAPQLIIPK